MDDIPSSVGRSQPRQAVATTALVVAGIGCLAASLFVVLGGASAMLVARLGEPLPSIVYWYPVLVLCIGLAMFVHAWGAEPGRQHTKKVFFWVSLASMLVAATVSGLLFLIYLVGMYSWQHPLIFLSAIILSAAPGAAVFASLVFLDKTRSARGTRVAVVALIAISCVALTLVADVVGRELAAIPGSTTS